jgi:hypothetical protein
VISYASIRTADVIAVCYLRFSGIFLECVAVWLVREAQNFGETLASILGQPGVTSQK